jgi:hypothetical protein
MSPRAIAKASFSAHGGKVAIAIFGGEVHVFSGVALTPIDIFSIQVMSSFASSSLLTHKLLSDLYVA